MPDPTPAAVLVTVAADRRSDIAALADAMRAEGMTVDAVLGSIGVVTGRATPEQSALVARLPGVVGVEADRTVDTRDPG